MSNSDFDVVIIGAGFGGLAVTAALIRYGVNNVCLLEGGQSYGNFWITNYDRISLHTAWHCLPDDGGDNDNYPMFKTRDQLLAYFRNYAARHRLQEFTRFDTMVSNISRDAPRSECPWSVISNKGDFEARYVVVASGYCRRPVTPAIENQAAYKGDLRHSKAYRNARPYVGKRVLVVGTGNSGAEIATQLVEAGSSSVAMLGSGPRWYVPIAAFSELLLQAREMGGAGPAGVINLHPFTPGTQAFDDQLLAFDEMLTSLAEDLSEFGLDRPKDGAFTEFNRTHRVPVIDHGAAPLIRSGDIEVIKDRLEAFTTNGVRLIANGERDFDAVILATGFESGLEEFVPAELTEVVPSHGNLFPKTDRRCRSTVHDDLYFIGFDQALMSGSALGVWGFEVAEKIATDMRTFSAGMRPEEFARAPWKFGDEV